MSFKNPEFFILLIPLLAVVIWNLLNEYRWVGSLQISSRRLFDEMGSSLKVTFKFVPLLFKLMAFVFLVIALARPQESTTKVKRNVEGIDIVLSLDISDSMLIEDMTPKNRMEAAKKIIKDFVSGRSSDRIGVVVFSGEAYTRIPPTLDYKMLLSNISEIGPTRTLKMGTAIGVGLATAVARLKESTAKSKVIIFMTDGENNSGTIDPETALELAKGFGIKVYSIGVGVDGDAQLPIYSTDAFGNTIKRYQPIHSSVNDDLLGRMASETGGKYYRATNSQALKNVFDDINKLEKTKVEVNQYTQYAEVYPRFLSWAIFFFLAFFISQHFIWRRAL